MHISDIIQGINDLALVMKLMAYIESLGYEFTRQYQMCDIIKRDQIDISQFTLPYGAADLDAYKKIVAERDEEIKESCKGFIRRRMDTDPEAVMWDYKTPRSEEKAVWPDDFRLKVTREQYMRILNELVGYLIYTYDVTAMSDVTGQNTDVCSITQYAKDTGYLVEIFLNASVWAKDEYCMEHPDGTQTFYYSDNAVLELINAAFHAGRNCYQSNVLTREPSDEDLELGKQLAVAYIARYGNPGYYTLYHGIYTTEVDAECTALPQTYLYMRKRFDLDPAVLEQVMLKFVNYKCQYDKYPLTLLYGPPYTDLAAAMKDISECFEKSQTCNVREIISEKYFPDDGDTDLPEEKEGSCCV